MKLDRTLCLAQGHSSSKLRTVFIKRCTARCFILNFIVVQWDGVFLFFFYVFTCVQLLQLFSRWLLLTLLCKYVIFTCRNFKTTFLLDVASQIKLFYSRIWTSRHRLFTVEWITCCFLVVKTVWAPHVKDRLGKI